MEHVETMHEDQVLHPPHLVLDVKAPETAPWAATRTAHTGQRNELSTMLVDAPWYDRRVMSAHLPSRGIDFVVSYVQGNIWLTTTGTQDNIHLLIQVQFRQASADPQAALELTPGVLAGTPPSCSIHPQEAPSSFRSSPTSSLWCE